MRLKQVIHVGCMEDINICKFLLMTRAYKILVRKPDGKTTWKIQM